MTIAIVFPANQKQSFSAGSPLFGAYVIDGRLKLNDVNVSTYRIVVITCIPVIIESCAIIIYKTTLAHSSSSCLLQCGSEILETTLKHNTMTYLVAGLSSHKLIFICVEQSKNLTHDLPWFQLPQFLELLCSDLAQ